MKLILVIKKIWLPVIAVAAIVLAGIFFYQNMQLKKNPQAVAQKETTDLVAKVSRLVVLPEGETPTVATVADPAVLKDQPFFAHAEKGDKVLIYTTSKKAILYSVSKNKILDVAPLNIGNQPAAKAAPAPVTPVPATATPAPVKK